MIIYKIVNKINGMTYVGQTKYSLDYRVAQHIYDNSTYIQKALNKYGLQSFDTSIIDTADTKELLDEKERYWIKTLNCKAPNGYNLTDGGEGLTNPSQETRDKIAAKIKSFGKNPNFTFKGGKHSDSTKDKIRQSLKDTMSNPEIRAKLGSGFRGKKLSEETKRKISEANKVSLKGRIPWNKGKRMSDFIENYENPMKGKERPDLTERNIQRAGKEASFGLKEKQKIAQQLRRKRESEAAIALSNRLRYDKKVIKRRII